jgi:hypothetical protein
MPGHDVITVRPDGHIGYHGNSLDDTGLRAWLSRTGASGCAASNDPVRAVNPPHPAEHWLECPVHAIAELR